MAVLDSSIANVALPTLSRELHADVASSIWVVNAYQVAVTMLLLAAVVARRRARLSARLSHGTRHLHARLARLRAQHLARRPSCSSACLQGAGAAALMSIAPALNRTIFPARMLGRGRRHQRAHRRFEFGRRADARRPRSSRSHRGRGSSRSTFRSAFSRPPSPGARCRDTRAAGGGIDVPSALTSGPALGAAGRRSGRLRAPRAGLRDRRDARRKRRARRRRSYAASARSRCRCSRSNFSEFAASRSPSRPRSAVSARRASPSSRCRSSCKRRTGTPPSNRACSSRRGRVAIAIVAPLAGPPGRPHLGRRCSRRRGSPRSRSGSHFCAALPAHPLPADIVVARARLRARVSASSKRRTTARFSARRPARAAPRRPGVLATARLTGQSLGAADRRDRDRDVRRGRRRRLRGRPGRSVRRTGTRRRSGSRRSWPP